MRSGRAGVDGEGPGCEAAAATAPKDAFPFTAKQESLTSFEEDVLETANNTDSVSPPSPPWEPAVLGREEKVGLTSDNAPAKLAAHPDHINHANLSLQG